jgi:hypothetical protein
MKKDRRTLRLRTETVRVLSGAMLAQAAGGLYTEPATTSSFTIVRTHCPYMSDCVAPQPK